jgi:catechol 2,3-dioxygenase
LGFSALGRSSDGKVPLSTTGKSSSHIVELLETKVRSERLPVVKCADLYHFAILLPERKYLADMLQNLIDKHNQAHFDGLADHLVSEPIYIRDPDFNGIEIYRDKPHSERRRSNGFPLQMSTVPLDTGDC